MQIAIFSDPHTTEEGLHPFEIDVRQNFLDIVSQIQAANPDFLIITGDLCFKEGSEAVYRWQKQILDQTGIPYFLIPGNHDNTELMTKLFDHLPPMVDQELYYEARLNDESILFLDSAKGYLTPRQKSWLKDKLSARDQAYVCMHHPPDFMQVPHMDNQYFLQDREEVMQIFKGAKIPVYLFCGHYHVDKSAHFDQLHVFITPSCFFQIDDSLQDFSIDHTRIAYRSIHIADDRLDTKVYYFEGNMV